VNGIGLRLQALAELRIGHIGRVQHLAIGIKLPAMVDTSQPALFHTPEHQRSRPMRAELIEYSHAPIGTAKRHEGFA
jgi:hypothetical protein